MVSLFRRDNRMDEEEINEAELEALLMNWYYYQKEQ